MATPMSSSRIILVLTLGLLSLTACEKENKTSAEQAMPPLVKVTHPALADTFQIQTLVGQVVPQVESSVGFQVAGRIEHRLVRLGESVEKGQKLFLLDSTDYQLKVQAVKAKIRSTESDLETAKRDLARLVDLRHRKLVSQQQVDNAQNAVTKLTAALAALQPELELAQNQLAYTQLTAPISGVVTAVLADRGQVVGTGTPVVKLAQTHGKLAQFDLPEALKQQLPQLPATLTVQVGGQNFQAKFYQQAPTADPVSRTWTVAYQLPDEPGVSRITFGQTATADFTHSTQEKVWQVPNTAILIKNSQAYLYVVADNKLVLKPVQVVKLFDRTAWVTGKLSAEDTIVRMGVHTLHASEVVRVSQDG